MAKPNIDHVVWTAFLIAGLGCTAIELYDRSLNERSLWQGLWLYLILFGAYGILGVWALPVRWRSVRWRTTCALLVLLTISVQVYNPEWVRAETTMEASLDDDLTGMHLRIRADGSCTVRAYTWLTTSVYDGRCEIREAQIFFHERPYENDFLPPVAEIVGDKIVLRHEADGTPDIQFGNHFTIRCWESLPEGRCAQRDPFSR